MEFFFSLLGDALVSTLIWMLLEHHLSMHRTGALSRGDSHGGYKFII